MKEKPACLVTTTVTDYRSEPFRMLAEAENLEVLAHDCLLYTSDAADE